MMLLQILALVIVIPVLFIYLLGKYVDVKLKAKDLADVYNDCHKVWTARGIYGEGIDENSIESIGHAFSEGALGVEVDVFFDVAMNDYIVSHNFPYQLKNGRILRLKELFDALGDEHYFWLDFKKLRRLSKPEALQAVQRLQQISQKNNLHQRIYVEGETPINLAHFRKAGFHTIFDTHPEVSGTLLAAIMITLYKIFYYFGDHSVMGMEYGSLEHPVYGKETRQRLGRLPVFLYHVPVDESLVNELLDIEAVRAFIVGNNQSVNFYHLNACDRQKG